MIRNSKLKTYLHWITFLLIAVTYASIELRGLFPKGGNMYAFIKQTHYNSGLLVCILMLVRLCFISQQKKAIRSNNPTIIKKFNGILLKVLYIIFLITPLTGIAIMLFGSKYWDLLYFKNIPFIYNNSDIKNTLKQTHELIANSGYFAIFIHSCISMLLYLNYRKQKNTLDK